MTDTEKLQEFRRRLRNWLRDNVADMPECLRYEALQHATLAVADAMYDEGRYDGETAGDGVGSSP